MSFSWQCQWRGSLPATGQHPFDPQEDRSLTLGISLAHSLGKSYSFDIMQLQFSAFERATLDRTSRPLQSPRSRAEPDLAAYIRSHSPWWDDLRSILRDHPDFVEWDENAPPPEEEEEEEEEDFGEENWDGIDEAMQGTSAFSSCPTPLTFSRQESNTNPSNVTLQTPTPPPASPPSPPPLPLLPKPNSNPRTPTNSPPPPASPTARPATSLSTRLPLKPISGNASIVEEGT